MELDGIKVLSHYFWYLSDDHKNDYFKEYLFLAVFLNNYIAVTTCHSKSNPP